MSAVSEFRDVDLRRSLMEAKAGSNQAIEHLFGECRDYLLYIASRELDDDLRAKMGGSDIVQESLIKAHRSFSAFQGQTEGELLSWLRQILIRTFLDAHRRYRSTERRRVDREMMTEHPNALKGTTETPSVQLISGEKQEAIQAAIDRLPDDYSRVIRARLWERKSFVAIAADMNRTPDAVRKLWFRGVDQLRRNWRVEKGGDDFE